MNKHDAFSWGFDALNIINDELDAKLRIQC